MPIASDLSTDLPTPAVIKQRMLAVFESTIDSFSTSSQPLGQYGIALGIAGALHLSELITKDEYTALAERALSELSHAGSPSTIAAKLEMDSAIQTSKQ